MEKRQQLKQKEEEAIVLYTDFCGEMDALEKEKDLIVKKFLWEIDKIRINKTRDKLKKI
jgi:hypothetical protein